MLTRVAADHLSTAFKQQFFVEIRAGAGGRSASSRSRTPRPTATTSSSPMSSHLVLHPIGNPKLNYDP